MDSGINTPSKPFYPFQNGFLNLEDKSSYSVDMLDQSRDSLVASEDFDDSFQFIGQSGLA